MLGVEDWLPWLLGNPCGESDEQFLQNHIEREKLGLGGAVKVKGKVRWCAYQLISISICHGHYESSLFQE
jgi:hypothetical protein